MKSAWVGRVAVAAGLLGAGVALWLLLPLPPASDLYAARGWGVGAGYVGFIFGFPLGVLAMPLAVGLHPLPAGNDASGAGTMAAVVAGIVAFNWAGWGALFAALVSTLRRRRARAVAHTSRPPA